MGIGTQSQKLLRFSGLEDTRGWRVFGLEEHRERGAFVLDRWLKMLQSRLQSILSLTGCASKRRGAADVTRPRGAFADVW